MSIFQLISHIEEEGLDTEGLLRIPGVATRVKVLLPEEKISSGKKKNIVLWKMAQSPFSDFSHAALLSVSAPHAVALSGT